MLVQLDTGQPRIFPLSVCKLSHTLEDTPVKRGVVVI